MDRLRVILLASLACVLVWLGNAWLQDQSARPSLQTDSINTKITANHVDPVKINPSIPKVRKIAFETDVFTGVIDKTGGELVYLALRHYPQTASQQNPQQPFVLFNHTDERYYTAQSDLLEIDTSLTNYQKTQYDSPYTDYKLSSDQNVLCISLSRGKEGINIQKHFIFKPGSYEIEVQQQIHNNTDKTYLFAPYAKLTQKANAQKTSWFSTQAYTGSIIPSDAQRHKKIDFNQLNRQALPKHIHNGWLSFVEPYFASAWISKLPKASYYSEQKDNQYTLGMRGDTLNLAPSQTVTTHLSLYAGPKAVEQLQLSDQRLAVLVDYGTFSFIAKPLVRFLKKWHQWLGHWIGAIICALVSIRVALMPISAKAFQFTRIQNQLQPKIAELTKRYGNDWQQFMKARTTLYQQAGISATHSMLLILVALINFSILFAWLAILRETIELRQVVFTSWIPNLFSTDPYYIFPILLGLSSYVNLLMDQKNRLNTPETSTANNYAALLPSVLFVLLFSNFPVGSILYYLLEQSLSAFQKWWLLGKPLPRFM